MTDNWWLGVLTFLLNQTDTSNTEEVKISYEIFVISHQSSVIRHQTTSSDASSSLPEKEYYSESIYIPENSDTMINL